MVRALVPCFCGGWSVVRKVVWLSVALSVSRVPSLGRVDVILSECRGCVGMTSMLSYLCWCGMELHLLRCGDLQEFLVEETSA